jgi:hypothetical protein
MVWLSPDFSGTPQIVAGMKKRPRRALFPPFCTGSQTSSDLGGTLRNKSLERVMGIEPIEASREFSDLGCLKHPSAMGVRILTLHGAP